MSGLPHPFEATQRAMAGPEIPHNDAGVPTQPNRRRLIMTVREALEKTRGERYCDHDGYDDRCHNCTAWLVEGEVFADLAPIIERALRAAYRAGANDGFYRLVTSSDDGVTAGVAAMVERDDG